MRILITGANGQLAKTIEEIYPQKNLYLGTRDILDITNKNQLEKQVLMYRPHMIFHFASLTRGDECALYPEKAYNINVAGTDNVVEACKKANASLLFVSTNEVFDGFEKKPYSEHIKPNPITIVGKTKHEAEKIIQKKLKKYFIIRTSWLYSKWNSNFIHAVLKKARTEKKIELVVDEISTPTYSLDLAYAIKKLIRTQKYGTYHLANEGIVSRLDFARKAFEILNLSNIDIVPVPLDKFQRVSKPPLYSPLKNFRAKKLGIFLPHWEDALERFINAHRLDYA